MIEAAGVVRCPIVTGGGSGDVHVRDRSGAYDEIQPGSYIFMDADYARNEWACARLPRFEQCAFVLATVDDRPAPVRAGRRRPG
jgi:D-serine deaminase-like pyridoxal phosphate-dependent protein